MITLPGSCRFFWETGNLPLFTAIGTGQNFGYPYVYVVVQFYPWFKFYFPLFWGVVMYANESKTKENKI